ncbi:MAG: hypothetical protein CM1200mP12_22390 [Gammaproteobacteria bacterium]|nr:MAG: hypothetical protein CM1200mP12_22390 [Gammaproteobacteria bacterium]
MDLIVKPGKALKGEILIPGDKSISHRSIMCARSLKVTAQFEAS